MGGRGAGRWSGAIIDRAGGRMPNRERGHGGLYVVDADDARAALDGQHRGDHAGRIDARPLVVGSIERRRRHADEPRERRLARPADEERHAEREQLVLALEQREVVGRRLAEADAGIDDEPSGDDAGPRAASTRARRNVATSTTTSA